ncbi:MAG: XdhC family protein [Pseudomonadota bacterium]
MAAMRPFEIFATIERLRRAGQPFCVATVVRTADVTSAKAGAKAAVTEGGEILGHLGGACVRGAVQRAAAEALASGEVRVIRVKPADRVVALQDEDGAAVFRSGCPSGGTVDLLIEPYRPAPMLAIFGRTPIAAALARQAALLGFRLALTGAVEGLEADPIAGTDLGPLALGPRDFVVVASQGEGDVAALRAAVESAAGHVSMVASARKAAALGAKLRAGGVPAERLARLKSPAGLDLGGIDPGEIALSVLAEIVLWRNAARRAGAEAGQQA